MVTLKQILDFLVLAEELHFARAAERLGISQAALSLEIRKLENSLGCSLFDRSDRWKIRLTEAGAAYRHRVRGVPGIVDGAAEAAKRAARGETGQLSIIVASTVYETYNMVGLIQRMCRKYPGVKLKIQDRISSPQAAEVVRSGECDVGIFALIHQSSTAEGLRYIPIARSDMELAFPVRHPLARKPDLRIEDLRHCSFIFPPREEAPILRRLFEEYFMARCHALPEIEHEAAGFSAIRQLAAAGLGVALVHRGAPDENLVYRPLPDGMKRSIVAAWDENNHSPALHNFLRLLEPVETD